MNHFSKVLALLCAIGACAVSGAASADNLLGLYAGAGAGESTVRSDHGFDPYYPVDSHPHHTTWKVFTGIRPIPILGAEAEYIDFGHPSSADASVDGAGFYGTGADSHPRAGVLSAVGYLPLPFIDVFGKVGMARLETNLNTYSSTAVLSRQIVWQSKVAYGAGVQAHFWGVAVRGEYERISSKFGDPDALMVSAAWTF
jgi:hypothetical protein